MIKFLLERPIAVIMAFTACFLIGGVTYFTLPASLLPDIDIPEITVQLSGQHTSARELENTLVKPVRQQLMQVTQLRDMQTETRDGAAIIRLNFNFGTDIHLAFIEVNEKVDAAMNYLPYGTERPRVIQASATDIPVFCLNLTLKTDDVTGLESTDEAFFDLCEFAETVLKRRIEQLPEVAMVDITGIVRRQLQIVPDRMLLDMAGISLGELEEALKINNIEPGSMIVRDGYYEYNIRFPSLLRTPEDVKNIYLRKEERIFQLKDLAKVSIVPIRENGFSLANGKRAVTLAVIKQADENMEQLKQALDEVTDFFASQHPDITFSISRDQRELLDYTMSNLKQNFVLGFLFICMVAVLFLGDIKSPFVIGLSMVISLVTSFLFFYLFHVSLNIVSLCGLILAQGMMIDNAIIVTENIAQYRAMGYSLKNACERGTTEVITPMLSSILTTIVVFVPLVFMSGIAGAIFYDQAFAVTVGLTVSYFVGIMLLPVLYQLIYQLPQQKAVFPGFSLRNLSGARLFEHFYDRGVDFIFRHKIAGMLTIVVSFLLCVYFFSQIPKSRMPEIDRQELVSRIDWNENIHADENRKRIHELLAAIDSLQTAVEYTAYIGQQQYLLNRDRELSVSEAEVYVKTAKTTAIFPLQTKMANWLHQRYPAAVFTFSPPETIFEKIFYTGEADIVAELYPRNKVETPTPDAIHALEKDIRKQTGLLPTGIAFDNQLNIIIDRQKLLLYRIDYNEVYRLIRTLFRDYEAATLRSFQQYLPIVIAGEELSVNEVMRHAFVRTQPDEKGRMQTIPLQSLVKITPAEDLKTITAGKNGEYIPFRFYDVADAPKLIADVKQYVRETQHLASEASVWDADFSGSFFSNRRMLNELIVILLISVGLMYFILAAQFESFLQPLIVLIEIPIDVAAALGVLWLCGHTLNLMSAIGIVVTCGIIINDSILKIDAINELRKSKPLMEAIHEAGRRRLRPIVMTSLTTVLAMTPLLFSYDMGSELQKPLSVAMIASMIIGTAVSLFIIPLAYWFIYQKKEVIHEERYEEK